MEQEPSQLGGPGEVVAEGAAASPAHGQGGAAPPDLVRALNERVKELTALHGVARLLDDTAATTEDTLRQVVALLPPALQHAEVAAARIAVDDVSAETPGFRLTPWLLHQEISLGEAPDTSRGGIDVVYLEERPPAAEGPFLAEERVLLGSVGEMLGGFLRRKQIEQSLRQSERRFRAFVERSGDAMGVLTADGTISYVSPHNTWPHRRRAEELVGRQFHELLHPDDVGLWQEALAAVCAESGASSTVVVRIRAPDSSMRWVEIMLTNLLNYPVVGGVLCNCRDVTENQTREEALRETNSRLSATLDELRRTQEHVIQQERLRALGEMASGIAHDLNNALAPVIGFSDLLIAQVERLTQPEDARRYLELINTGAADAAAIVARLREFYRGREAGDATEEVDLCQLAEQVIELTRPRWAGQAQAEGRTISIERRLEPVPALIADRAALRQALTNLVFNAVDAMPQGGTLAVETRAVGGWAQVSISDSGTGMPEEVRRRVLEPFFTTKGERGTGMGLTMVNSIAQRHGGRIEIQSAPGVGTTVTLHLPVREALQTRANAVSTEQAIRPLRVLVVDDQPTPRQTLAVLLAHDGHEVEQADSAIEGLRLMRAHHFDVIITDRAMPDMSGDEFASLIAQEEDAPPVLMLTGFGGYMSAVDERPTGVAAVLAKPVSLMALRQAFAALR